MKGTGQVRLIYYDDNDDMALIDKASQGKENPEELGCRLCHQFNSTYCYPTHNLHILNKMTVKPRYVII